MQAFEYIETMSLDQAIALLSHDPERSRPFAGGTDLLPQLREGRRQVGLVVDVKQIPELRTVVDHPERGLRIGAAAACYDICHNPTVATRYPGLVDGFGVIGAVQIQFRASVGGNLCNASPAADSIPALIVHGATCTAIGPNGQRAIPVERFCVAPGRTELQPGEILAWVDVPAPPAHFGAAYLRFIPRNEMDIAVVGVGASVTLDGERCTSARIALGAVGPTVIVADAAAQALVGSSLDDATLARAAEAARAAARPITDMRAPADYRREITGVLVRRVVAEAARRARRGA